MNLINPDLDYIYVEIEKGDAILIDIPDNFEYDEEDAD